MNLRLYVVMFLALSVVSGCIAPQTTTPDKEDFSLTYRRSGGIAGFDDELVIPAGGAAQVRRRDRTSEIALAPEKVALLKQLVEQAGFFDLKSDYPAPTAGADYMQYSISVRLGARQHTVRTETTGTPPSLEPLIRELDGIVGAG